MKDYFRLFDILKYQENKYPRKDSLNYKYNGNWRNYSTQEVNTIVDSVSKAFIAKDIQSGDKVALISSNRPEWNFIDNGMMQIGAINVPIYPTISESDYKYIFKDAEIKMAFVGDLGLYNKIMSIKKEVPSLREVYCFEKHSDIPYWEDFTKEGEKVDDVEITLRSDTIKAEDLATIIYTSGTTGLPKGVMLSHNNIVSNIKSVLSVLPIGKEYIALSFLPLCHIFERVVTYTYFATGMGVYYAESIETISNDLKDVKPNFFSTVPRLLEKVYEAILAKGMELTGFKKRLFFWALNIATEEYNENYKPGIKFKIADKLIYSKWREALGGNVIGIVTGAAALQERLGRVFSAAGIPIREGYGQTETSPVVTVNQFEPGTFKFGTVGIPIPGVEVKIAENGEVLVKGPNVMMGYYNKPEETKKVFTDDGWLHTGDVGTFVDDKFLKITDRVKSLFKTSGGKYVAPQVVEEKMKESRFIEQIMVIGENRKFVSALIVPSFLNLSKWCDKRNIKYTNHEDMVKLPEVIALFTEEIGRLNEHFGKIEKIKKFSLLPNEWSIETGELTPTMKVKRKVVLEKYSTLIDTMYEA